MVPQTLICRRRKKTNTYTTLTHITGALLHLLEKYGLHVESIRARYIWVSRGISPADAVWPVEFEFLGRNLAAAIWLPIPQGRLRHVTDMVGSNITNTALRFFPGEGSPDRWDKFCQGLQSTPLSESPGGIQKYADEFG